MWGRSPAHRYTVIVLAMITFALALAPSLMAGCTGANQRQATLRAHLVALDAAREGLVTWSTERQAKIVGEATTRDEAEAKLYAHRTERQKLVELLQTAYRALAYTATHEDSIITLATEAASNAVSTVTKAVKESP